MLKQIPKYLPGCGAYSEAVEMLHVVWGVLLFEFSRHDGPAIREEILRNFIARAFCLSAKLNREHRKT